MQPRVVITLLATAGCAAGFTAPTVPLHHLRAHETKRTECYTLTSKAPRNPKVFLSNDDSSAAMNPPSDISPVGSALPTTLAKQEQAIANLVPFGIAAACAAALAAEPHSMHWMQHGANALWRAYSHSLSVAPIPTKALTSGTVYAIGDILAQNSERENDPLAEQDGLRVLRSMLAGLLGHGVLSHFWYNISESFFSSYLHWDAWYAVFPKIAVDQLVWGPIWNGTYLLMLGLMKRDDLGNIFSDIQKNTVPLLTSGLKLWPLAHIVTYGLCPTEYRLLWVDTVEILWVMILASQANQKDQPPATVDTR